MMYPFITLDDGTEIVHSEMREDGTVKEYMEKPVEGGFHLATCILSNYEWSAISKFDRFWYVIYEHETVKDKNARGAVCKFRYDLLQAFDGTGKSPTSYIGRMKNRVNFKRMMILELNRANCGRILSAFNQGHQPNGGKRAPKFLINKSNVENYQVFHYEA